MKIVDFGAFSGQYIQWDETDLTVTFEGEQSIVGEYAWSTLENDYCFYPDEEYAELMPRLENDAREMFFCFSNSSLANELFDSENIDPSSPQVQAEIKIDNYQYNYAPGAAYSVDNEAELIEIVNSNP